MRSHTPALARHDSAVPLSCYTSLVTAVSLKTAYSTFVTIFLLTAASTLETACFMAITITMKSTSTEVAATASASIVRSIPMTVVLLTKTAIPARAAFVSRTATTARTAFSSKTVPVLFPVADVLSHCWLSRRLRRCLMMSTEKSSVWIDFLMIAMYHERLRRVWLMVIESRWSLGPWITS